MFAKVIGICFQNTLQSFGLTNEFSICITISISDLLPSVCKAGYVTGAAWVTRMIQSHCFY